jgi:hypothetical protein
MSAKASTEPLPKSTQRRKSTKVAKPKALTQTKPTKNIIESQLLTLDIFLAFP